MRDKQAYVPSINNIGRSVKLPTITRYCDFLDGFNVLYEYGRSIAGSIYRGCSELLTHIFGIYIYPHFYQRPDVHVNVMSVGIQTRCTQKIRLRFLYKTQANQHYFPDFHCLDVFYLCQWKLHSRKCRYVMMC